MRHMPMAIVSRPAFIRAAVYGLSGLIVSTGAVNDAGAAEICVSCEGPVAAYRCDVEGTAASVEADGGLQFLCIRDIAQRRGHATCAVARQGAAGCNGEPWRITRDAAGTETDAGSVVIPRLRTPPVDGQAAQAATRAGEPTAKVPDTTQQKAAFKNAVPSPTGGTATGSGQPTHFVPPREGEAPRVAAPAGTPTGSPEAHQAARSGETSPSAIESAGEAIGGAAKKSWECVTSLFKRC